jgi:LysM repeat protein
MYEILLFALLSATESDSLRMEMIRGKQYVVYQVGPRETLYSISRRYGASVQSILEQNPTADAGLEIGQILKIPYAPRPKTVPAVKTSQGIIHKVVAKETLFSLARQYNVTVDDIKFWNTLKDNSLTVGQDILIKKAPSTDPVAAKTNAIGAKTHTVAAKETLYSIARQYNMSVQELKEWNSITDSEVKVGQVLTVAMPTAQVTELNKTTETSVAVVTTNDNPVLKTDNSVKISETVSGSDEVKETGLAELIEGSEGNRKYLAQHRSIKPGTILKIRNLDTSQEVFVRVTGPIVAGDPATVIKVSKSAHDRLGAAENKFRAEIIYYK